MSSNKYIPPRLRNKVPPAKEEAKPYEQEFPALGNKPVSTTRVWGGTGSFAEKAKEWNTYERENQQKLEQEKREQQMLNAMIGHRTLPQIRNIRKFREESESEEEEKPDQTTTTNFEDGDDNTNPWITKTSKTRKTKVVKPDSDSSNEETDEKPSETNNDGSVWDDNEKELNETCWDEKNY